MRLECSLAAYFDGTCVNLKQYIGAEYENVFGKITAWPLLSF